MSEYFFGVGSRRVAAKVAAKLDRIATKHGASFVAVRLPDGYRYWFAGPNLGHPFDKELSQTVLGEAERCGFWLEGGPC